MKPLRIDLHSIPEKLRAGLAGLMAERPHRFSDRKGALPLRFDKQADSSRSRLSVRADAIGITVQYARITDAFRALGRLLGCADPARARFAETARFDLLGTMLDVSRNAVVRPDVLKSLLRRIALMGLDTVLLYMEDTYEVPGEPFFGYLRGGYTQAELKDLDACAAQYGIELMPCIQTLGHLEQILQWPAYRDLKDAGGVLIAEHEATYALIEKMIAAASGPFRSKRIHIGMDEAHGIGSGGYKQKFGDKDPFLILNAHLNRVREICRARGLKPMIWSDMYFRLGSKNHDYYDTEWSITPEVVAGIPKDVQLVYWDYYHVEQAFYEEWIERHRKLGSEPVMAGGVWTWNHLWTAMPFTRATTDACLQACKVKGLREVFATMWGDDGYECDLFSALPGLQYFAEYGWNDALDEDLLRANFHGSCEGDYDALCKGSELDSPPGVKKPEHSHNNISKALLWQDPLLAPLEAHTNAFPMPKHYEKLGKTLERLARDTLRNAMAERLNYPAQVAKVLALKTGLRSRLSVACRKKDRKKLKTLLSKEVLPLRREVAKLRKIHRHLWLGTYKAFGWEVIDHRYGGLDARLDTLIERLRAFASGKLEHIEELEAPLTPVFPFKELDQLPNLNHDRVKTPSFIK